MFCQNYEIILIKKKISIYSHSLQLKSDYRKLYNNVPISEQKREFSHLSETFKNVIENIYKLLAVLLSNLSVHIDYRISHRKIQHYLLQFFIITLGLLLLIKFKKFSVLYVNIPFFIHTKHYTTHI